MVLTWEAEHRDHELWTAAEEAQMELTAQRGEKEGVSVDDPRWGRLRGLFTYVASFRETPHPTITEQSLDSALERLQRIREHLPDLDVVYRVSGNNGSEFGRLAQTVRSWPVPASGRLTGLSGQVEALTSEISNAETQMREHVESFKEHLEERRHEQEQSLNAQLEDLRLKLTETKSQLLQKTDDLTAQLQHIQDDARTAEQVIEKQKSRLDEALKEHERSHADLKSKQTEDWAEQLQRHETAAQQHLGQMADHEEQSRKILGAVGINATATDYGKYAQNQNSTANKWRLGAAIAFCIAGVVFVSAMAATFLGLGPRLDWWEMALQRIGAPVGVAGIGLFFASESKQHRKEERKARGTELTLVALEPFIANLPEKQQAVIRYETAQTLFSSNDEKEGKVSGGFTSTKSPEAHQHSCAQGS